VTGIGVVSPVGNDARSTWEAIAAGRSGVVPISRFDATGYETTIAAEVKDFDATARLGRKDARRTDRYTHYAVASALEALEQAGLMIDVANADRVGVLMGSGMGGAETLDSGMETVLTEGPGRLSPFFMPMFLSKNGFGDGGDRHWRARTELLAGLRLRQLGPRDRRSGRNYSPGGRGRDDRRRQ
jgi:3-oxoacyl-[acyl-carrier-protein] synthase II